MEVIYLTAIMVMRVVQAIYSKKANILLPNTAKSYIAYTAVSKLFAAGFALVLFLIEANFSGLDGTTVLIATCSGIFLAIGGVFSILALKTGTMVLNSLFATAGMIIPCILGHFVFQDYMSWQQILCIIAFLGSSILMVGDTKKTFKGFTVKTIFYLIGSLISNGLVMFCQTYFGKVKANGNVSLFSLLTFIIPGILMSIILLFLPNKKEETAEGKIVIQKVMPKKLYLYATFLAVAVFIINQFVTILTPIQSPAVLFTFVMGGATVISAIVGLLIYKEKLTVKSTIGLVLALAAMVCIKIF